MTNMVKSLCITGCATLALLLSSTNSVAQTATSMPQAAQAKEYSDAELKKFADATIEIQKVQMEFQQQMAEAVKAEGIDPMKFQQMAQAQQAESASAPEYTAEEQKAFAAAMQKVMAMQEQVQGDIEVKLKEHNITMQQYQTMAMSIQQSPEMTKKVQKLMQES